MNIITSKILGKAKIVLTQGHVGTQTGRGDFAAYAGLSSEDDYDVYSRGAKLTAREAMGFFPDHIGQIENYRL